MSRDIIAIGGSLGAVSAVRALCAALPNDLAATIFIVIHVGAEGRNLLAQIFAQDCPLPVQTAVDGETVRQRTVYVAPADHHLLVINNVMRLGRGPRENLARPAIDPLFRSIALNYGSRAIGVVLTGMLNDGAAGLADMKHCGAVTIVQDPKDAQAPSMPLGALRVSEVDYRTSLSDLPKLLKELTSQEIATSQCEPSDDLGLEIDIALGHTSNAETMARLGAPTTLSCPACGGVLTEMKRKSPLRFRCQVGHAYTADLLEADSETSVDEAMRVALRIIEERIVLNRKMAEDARRSGYPIIAKTTDERARKLEQYSQKLRHFLAESS